MKNNETREQREAQVLQSEWSRSAACQGHRELVSLFGVILSIAESPLSKVSKNLQLVCRDGQVHRECSCF